MENQELKLKKDGRGGPRKNAGGARPGAGRKRLGDPLTATITICMSEAMRNELKDFQKERGITIRELLRFALDNFDEKEGQ